MNRTKIEWCDHTWNPVVGCMGGCSWCYAKAMNDRFKWIEDFSKPVFFPERLHEPTKLYRPSKIFVGSMCDLFGPGVERQWVLDVIREVAINPKHTFMFLTKRWSRYYNFPEFLNMENVMLGYTVIMPAPTEIEGIKQMAGLKKFMNVRVFISVEPMLGDFSNVDFRGIDLVIAGAMTGRNNKSESENKPHESWVKGIDENCRKNNIPLLFKNSLLNMYPEILKERLLGRDEAADLDTQYPVMKNFCFDCDL